jgi:acyl carrier protein
MQDLTSGSIAILRKYMRDPGASVGSTSILDDLGIDELDLPMICLDLEDAYGLQVAVEDAVETVADLVACLVASLALKTLPRPRRPRSRSGWMSTGVERRR